MNILSASSGKVNPSDKKHTVLVVDDEPMIRDLLTAVLSGHGYDVLTAGDGQEAVEMFRREPEGVELIVTDLAMPRKSGIELIVKPDLPVMVISADFSQVVKEDLDGISCITKPFNFAVLLHEVAHHLSR